MDISGPRSTDGDGVGEVRFALFWNVQAVFIGRDMLRDSRRTVRAGYFYGSLRVYTLSRRGHLSRCQHYLEDIILGSSALTVHSLAYSASGFAVCWKILLTGVLAELYQGLARKRKK